MNLFPRPALSWADPNARPSNVDGRTVEVASGELWSLGQLARIIGEEQHVNRVLKTVLYDGE